MNKPVATPLQATANFWNEYGADEWTDAVLALPMLAVIHCTAQNGNITRVTDNVEGDTAMEPFLGQIQLFPYTFAPRGWAPCDGQILAINQYTALFSLIGTNFGGDGRTTFALPKLAGPAEAIGYYIAMEGVFPSRS